MTDLRQAAQMALEALENERYVTKYTHIVEAITALRTALEQPQQEPTCPECKAAVLYECVACSSNNYPPKPEQEQMRMPKVGDRVICLEDESLGEVVSLTAGGSPDITFDDGSRGTYMVSEFAKLFGYVTPPAAQPEQVDCPRCGHVCSQREWVGLTEEEILDLFDRNNVYGSKWIEFARTVEAKLKAKND
jgi:hypothetical protein